jgi:short-subunit dehydrogenase
MIIITGITKGIGRAIAEEFAAKGYDLVGCARNRTELADFKRELENTYSIKCHFLSTDLSQPNDLENFVEFVTNLPQKPQALINNAALFQFGGILEEDESLLMTMLHTNLFSAYQLSKAVLPTMIANKKGHIFNICSSVIYQPRKNMGSYGISKFALYGMTKLLREELKPYGVKVTAVMAGSTFTDSWRDSNINPDRLVAPKDIATAILAAFLQSASSVTEEICIRPQEGDL